MNTPAFWFITRATGVTAIILLTLTVALGLTDAARLRSSRIPRFVVDAVHRNASMLAVVFVVLHIVTSVLDSYVNIGLLATVIPFASQYQPFWIGLGAVAVDLLLAVFLTSLVRRRIGYRAWRAVHWLAYGAWPLALAHGLGIGTDAATPWMIAITVGCIALVGAALAVRWRGRWLTPRPQPPRARRPEPATAALRPAGSRS